MIYRLPLSIQSDVESDLDYKMLQHVQLVIYRIQHVYGIDSYSYAQTINTESLPHPTIVSTTANRTTAVVCVYLLWSPFVNITFNITCGLFFSSISGST